MTMKRTSPWHLDRVHIDSFGKLANIAAGPLKPGMNVVFGENESGKTTLTSFIDGVLFGWPDGRSRQNTYKPVNAERSGRLVFADNTGRSTVLARTRNADGVTDELGLMADIDADTYHAVFSMDSDELLALDDTGEVTSRLLTASAGTAVSPTRVLAKLDNRIASYTSKAAGADHSIANLAAELESVESQLARAEEEAAQLVAEDHEFHDLEPARAQLAREHDDLNALIEGRSADLSLVQKLENQIADLTMQRAALEAQLAEVDADEGRAAQAAGDNDMDALRALSSAEERAIRDTLEDFQVERDRLANAADHAKRNHADSSAAYEVIEESIQQGATPSTRSKTAGQVVLSIILPAIALLAGIPTVVYGRQIASLSITAFGIFLVLVALIMGAAAIVVAFRSEPSGPSLGQRLEDARWVMLQDQKKLAACENELTELGEQIRSYLHFNHLDAAEGSLRRARSLLDDAREQRLAGTAFDQRRQGLNAQLQVVQASLDQAQAQRGELLADADVADVAEFEALLNKALDRRRQVMAEAERLDTRYGELAHRLSQARDEKHFAQLKQQRASLRYRLKTSKREYASLLLARRNLAEAIATWESQSQPQVYRLASRLFEDMTDGSWQQVRLGAGGDVLVQNNQGESREPLLLSLGTRQQLYLCLRIALLITANDVGRAAPVLADDILVNFDTSRRRAACKALLELAQYRQVILFTCHEETVSLMQELQPQANVIRL